MGAELAVVYLAGCAVVGFFAAFVRLRSRRPFPLAAVESGGRE